MDLVKEYALSQYEELGELNGNTHVRIVRNVITGKIAVKKTMGIGQKQVYDILKTHRSRFLPEIYECVEDGERLIVIEEYFEGRNLEDMLYEEELPEEAACGIVYDLCCALEPLHSAEPAVVCRDLKPENIMITSDRDVKLVDFDIARTVSPGKTRDTVVLGTKGFAAPEQCGYAQTDGRSDIYALGAVLNYCILRKLPSEELAGGKPGKIVAKCTALSPDDRYQDVEELKRALEQLYPAEIREARKGEKEQKGAGKRHGGHGRPGFHQESQKEAQKQAGWRRFLPPGFRSGKIWKMAAAVIGYLFLIRFSLSMEFKDGEVVLTGIRAFLSQLCFLLSQLAEIAIVFDYMGCQGRFPFLKRKSRRQQIVVYMVLDGILFILAAVIWAVVDGLIWGF